LVVCVPSDRQRRQSSDKRGPASDDYVTPNAPQPQPQYDVIQLDQRPNDSAVEYAYVR